MKFDFYKLFVIHNQTVQPQCDSRKKYYRDIKHTFNSILKHTCMKRLHWSDFFSRTQYSV